MSRYIQIDNGQDVIDSRDVISRIEELESDRQELLDAVSDAEETYTDACDDTSALDDEERENLSDAIDDAKQELAIWDEGREAEELKALKALADEAGGSPDWTHGETLIRDAYFEEYAEQLAEDIGAIQRNASWPNNHIDWKAAAEALQQDYTSVDFDGETYWIRG